MTNRIVRTITPTALLFLAHAAACWAQLAPPTITITPTSGPPGTRISSGGATVTRPAAISTTGTHARLNGSTRESISRLAPAP